MTTPLDCRRRDSPKFLFYNLIRGCNLKCTHCHFWKLDEIPEAQSLETIAEIVEEFAEITEGKGTVVTCGGEPTIRPDKFWGFCRSVRKHGLRLLCVQNGTYIKSAAIAERMLIEGPHEITISLDGPDAEMHDRFRGVQGSFESAVRALRLLCEARARLLMYEQPQRPKICAMTILCESLRGRLGDFYRLVLQDLGADKLKLNVIGPTFNAPDRDGHIDPYFAVDHIQSVEDILKEIRETDAEFGIARNPEWLETVKDYSQSILSAKAHGNPFWSTLSCQTGRQICNAGERNITCTDTGMLRSCFSNYWPGMQWEKRGDLARYWWECAPQWVGGMARCKRLCGISHSNRREPATLKPLVSNQVL